MAHTVRAAEQVLEFHSPNGGKRKTTAKDKARFRLDDVDYVLVKPKGMALGLMARKVNDAEQDTAGRGAAMLQVVGQLIGFIEEPGKSQIEARLLDPKDSLDVDTLMPIMRAVLNKMGPDDDGVPERPTGSRAASSSAPRRSGPSSPARTRSTRARG